MTKGWLEQYPHTPAKATNYSRGRQGYRPLWVVIHCTDTEYADSYPTGLGKYWAREDTGVSVHFAVSDTETRQYVSMEDTAYQARNPGNLRGIGIEIVGRSNWSRNEWMAHKLMLRRTAKLVAEISLAYGIKTQPILLSTTQLKGRNSGMTCHGDLSKTFNGTHTDPAPNFPWDAFNIEVRNALAGLGVDEERARVAASRVGAQLTDQEDVLMAVSEADFKALVEKVTRLNKQCDRLDDVISGKGKSFPGSNLQQQFAAVNKRLEALTTAVAQVNHPGTGQPG